MSSKGKVRADVGEVTPVESDENYPTPPWCVDRLLEEAPFPTGRWLEPCAGDGAIVRAVNNYHLAAGKPVPQWTLGEIRRSCRGDLDLFSTDVITADFRIFLADLQVRSVRASGKWPFDVVITNPPYSMAAEFIEGCRTLAPIVAMLLRMNFLASETRAELHRRVLPEQTKVLPNRPSFKIVTRYAFRCVPCGSKLTVDHDGVVPPCPRCSLPMTAAGQRTSSSDSTEYAWMIWTPKSGPVSQLSILGTTPLEVRKAQRPRPSLPPSLPPAEALATA